ncbi:hypothetical protein [Legionella jamestowniensis]|uniref:Coiled-coil protein n=1 Tax=Legionella jamestowniensis TaxID=455 RepID=A0A0W0UIJ1_9GAMM|nr:hypothetical protein [Legionella jamestowniensis]KTD07713.1 coiled-coil protein [Legionella jamestowniensis]OCH99450.1 hypothetical protein A8135_07145 [Legionella jamestowniensis]SFL61060.1 hypothetical protein SAMN02746073_1027 [Legionella jamestowniensis DSM 19215]
MVESAYKKRNEDFLKDKHAKLALFSRKNEASTAINSSSIEQPLPLTSQETLQLAEKEAKNHNYGFLATNRLLIEQEFDNLFTTLTQRGLYSDELRFYCYYCCILLKQYYVIYEQESKVKEYEKLLAQLNILCLQGKLPPAVIKVESFFQALGKKIAADLRDLLETPRKLSKLRDRVAISNLNRIYWFFCRTTIKDTLLLARELKWLEKLGALLGKEINVDSVINLLETPNGILRFFSVGFFAVRFIMNAGMVLKHVLAPTPQEKQLDWKKRFTNEIYKRHATFLNDIVWGTVNCLTNYNEVFGISAPVAGWVVAGFMFFDVCLILWRRQLEEKEYLTKRSQYLTELEWLTNKLTTGLSLEEREKFDKHYIATKEQLAQLELTWKAIDATYWFNATAAFLLMAGFSASMLFTPAVTVLGCYMLCTLAVAMYLSDGAYKTYKEKSLLLEHAQLVNQGEKAAFKAYQTARNDFVFTLAKNTIMPTLLIATFAVCWQAALVLAVAYAGFEIFRAYSKHTEAQKGAMEDNSGALTPC